jgi:hypothetical protein
MTSQGWGIWYEVDQMPDVRGHEFVALEIEESVPRAEVDRWQQPNDAPSTAPGEAE